jgi:hypothetical protein
MNGCPLQGNSSRGMVPYNKFYEIDEMNGLAVGILRRYATFPCSDLKKINYFVHKYYSYKTDYQQFGLIDYWQFPTEIETKGFGDCDCLAFFVASLLEAVSIPTRVCLGNSPYGYHAWCEAVEDDGQWMLLEVTNGKIFPWEYRQKMGYRPDLYINPDGCATPGEVKEGF